MQHLVFRLYGPLASWGNIGLGTHRPSLPAPTRSAILGLVAGALGYDRSDDEHHARLETLIGIAVRIEADGHPQRDYHTAQVFGRDRAFTPLTRRDELVHRENLHTILSEREYMADAAYTVALWTRVDPSPGAPSLADLKRALEMPRFTPCLGRRSCPTGLPFSPHIVEAETLKDAFDRVAFPEPDSRVLNHLRSSKSRMLRVEFDDHPQDGYGPGTARYPQRDSVASRARRLFHVRSVNSLTLNVEEEIP